MVGFDPNSPKYDFKNLDYVIAGATSGFVTRTLFQPLDVLKIRFQLQIEPIQEFNSYSKYRSMYQAVCQILKEEGAQALWKGIVPAQCLSMSYGALQFLSFELLTKQVWNHLPEKMVIETKPATNFMCGALSGCIATVGSFPFDVLRTRLVGQGEPKVYKNILHAASTMFQVEGIRSFYKGLIPTLVQIAPNTGAQFAFYNLFQDLWKIFIANNSESNVFQNSFCGAAAGIAAKTVVYPLDLIKKRIQVQGFEEARAPFGKIRNYKGLIDCAKCIVREEGALGLYKGLLPSILKAAFTTGSHFLYYEETLKILRYIDR